MRAATSRERPEEGLLVALMLGFTGGYIDAYTWISHGVLANAQTANLVLLWVNAAAGQWQEAFHFMPSLFAFFVGVVIASLFFAALGYGGLVINTEVPKELVEILQAIVILFAITLHMVFERMIRRRT